MASFLFSNTSSPSLSLGLCNYCFLCKMSFISHSCVASPFSSSRFQLTWHVPREVFTQHLPQVLSWRYSIIGFITAIALTTMWESHLFTCLLSTVTKSRMSKMAGTLSSLFTTKTQHPKQRPAHNKLQETCIINIKEMAWWTRILRNVV